MPGSKSGEIKGNNPGTNRGGGRRKQGWAAGPPPLASAHLSTQKGKDAVQLLEYLTEEQKMGGELLTREYYTQLTQWLIDRKCLQVVPEFLITNWAMNMARKAQCDICLSKYGFLGQNAKNGQPCPSPFMGARDIFQKAVVNDWYTIYTLVRDFTAGDAKTWADDASADLLD